MLILYGVADHQALIFVLIVHTVQTMLVILLGMYAWLALNFTRRNEERGTRKEEGGTRKEKRGTWRGGAIMALGLAVFLLVAIPVAFDAKKYELMEYDYLVRIKDWNGIIAKAEQQTPDKPMSVSATNLALAMTNQLGERAFEFYQRGSQGLLPPFERNYATTQLTGEIYFHLGLVNTAQRLAFEAMEAISNYIRVVAR
jgi:hypothetical protein